MTEPIEEICICENRRGAKGGICGKCHLPIPSETPQRSTQTDNRKSVFPHSVWSAGR